MARGKPDYQHEMIASAIAFGLSPAYPEAEITCGKKITDLGLKPDVFIVHRDGKRWAYEVVNKNSAVEEVKTKHQKYQFAGVHDYWIVTEALSPEKPISEEMLHQATWWFKESLQEIPARFKVRRNLQQLLLEIGDDRLYTFMLNKSLLKYAYHWGVRMAIMGIAIYRRSTINDYVELAEDMIPLPYFGFSRDGQFQRLLMDGDILQQDAESLLGITAGSPVFAADIFDRLNNLLQMDVLQTYLAETMQGVADKMRGIELDPVSKEVQAIMQLKEKPPQNNEEMLSFFAAIEQLLPLFPEDIRATLELFFRPFEEVQNIMSWEHWFQQDKHFLAYLDNELSMQSGDNSSKLN